MKKLVAILVAVLVLAPATFAADAASVFVESISGSLTVTGKKVGVLVVDAQSYLWPLTWTLSPTKTIVPADTFLTAGIKAEVIGKTGKIMVLNPPGMEKLVSPFVVMKSSQIDVQEAVAALTPSIVTKAVTALTPESLGLIQSMFTVSEFNGEKQRIDDYVAVYKKLLGLWGIEKLITVEQTNKFSCIIRGYDIDPTSVTATMVFQYYLTADGTAFGTNMKKPSNELKGPDYNVKEDKVKPEDSNMNTLAIIKRISDSLK